MATPTDFTRRTKRRALSALGWGLTCGAVAAGASLSVFLLSGERIEIPNAELNRRLPEAAITIAGAGVIGGLLGGLVVSFLYPTRDTALIALVLMAVVTGAIGGGGTIPMVVLFRTRLSPLESSTLMWSFIGFLFGLTARRLSEWVPGSINAKAKPDSVQSESVVSAALREEYQRLRRKWFTFRVLSLFGLIASLLLLCVMNPKYLD